MLYAYILCAIILNVFYPISLHQFSCKPIFPTNVERIGDPDQIDNKCSTGQGLTYMNLYMNQDS